MDRSLFRPPLMTLPRCPDCAAPSTAGKRCADLLYDLLLKQRMREQQHRLAVACFALQHPHTHSVNCLAVARFEVEAALQAAGQDPRASCPVSRWTAARLAQLGLHRRWHITVASFVEPHPGSDDELLLAWAREVMRKSVPPALPLLPS